MVSLQSKVQEIEALLQKELEEQGHVAFGRLLNSISSNIERNENYTEIQFFALDYGKYVNRQYNANELSYIPLEGNFKEWIKLRFNTSDEKEIKSIYFAIHQKWFSEGKPTKGSYRFSENGDRTGWINKVEQKIPKIIEKAGEDVANDILENGFNTN